MSGGNDDPDTCIPNPVKDFVFDLHDSSRRSHDPSDQLALYDSFRELSTKYYSTGPWPSPQSISSECGSDPLFLAFYRELTLRHLHSSGRPKPSERVDGWDVYASLFDILLAPAAPSDPGLYLDSRWAFDVLHEFVYQFQGFCQFRTSPGARKSRETAAFLSERRDAWTAEATLSYLRRLSDAGSRAPPGAGGEGRRRLGVFARVVWSRLECLLGDYRACLDAAERLWEDEAANGVVVEVFMAKLSVAYHAGVSYLMTRRYKDAIRVLGDICGELKRGFNSGSLNKYPGSDQFGKLYDRMIALLAVLTHICPSSTQHKLDESTLYSIRDKYSTQLSKIEAGEEGYEDLFTFACPKFISPAVPDYDTDDDVSGGMTTYNLQVKQFMNEMREQSSLRKLRSYAKLYTSIKIDKLAAFNDTDEAELIGRLMCYKHKMSQMERVVAEEGDGEEKNGDAKVERMGNCMDLNFYVKGDMVHVSNVEKTRRFETFFLKGIKQNEEIVKEAKAIDVHV